MIHSIDWTDYKPSDNWITWTTLTSAHGFLDDLDRDIRIAYLKIIRSDPTYGSMCNFRSKCGVAGRRHSSRVDLESILVHHAFRPTIKTATCQAAAPFSHCIEMWDKYTLDNP